MRNAANKTKKVSIVFNPSKYTKWYLSLIDRAKLRISTDCETELHHIIPVSLGGTECVSLTLREHFIAHLLLTKMMIDPKHKQKMTLAFFAMCNGFNQSSKYSSSRWFLIARSAANRAKSEMQKGIPKSPHAKAAMRLAQQRSYAEGRNHFSKLNSAPRSEKHCESIRQSKQGKPAAWLLKHNADVIKQKISLSNTGKIFSEAHRKNLSKSNTGQVAHNKGKKMSETQKEKLRKPKTQEHKLALRKPKTRGCCIFCRKETTIGRLKTLHQNCA